MGKLKSRLVDGGRVEHRRLSNLKDMRGEAGIERTLWQRKAIHSTVFRDIVIEAVPRHQGVPWIYRVVNAGTETGEARRQYDALANLHNVVERIENRRPDDTIVVDFIAVHL